ncbi:hypothetical protein ElyMa_006867100 [Elysia marginata]|uniref:Uncharacterized protein n=1 Tax=Elysia marginata TaxID=1093978 RepID=A0AAV4JBZ5_9GAST|nr:hypothetical protein ElyMa_006867100 [Elysia marginata]
MKRVPQKSCRKTYVGWKIGEKMACQVPSTKCSLLKLGSKKSEARYLMAEKTDGGGDATHQLAESGTEKDLGVVIDNNPNFKQHYRTMHTLG